MVSIKQYHLTELTLICAGLLMYVMGLMAFISTSEVTIPIVGVLCILFGFTLHDERRIKALEKKAGLSYGKA